MKIGVCKLSAHFSLEFAVKSSLRVVSQREKFWSRSLLGLGLPLPPGILRALNDAI
jgi:hypothetical protein